MTRWAAGNGAVIYTSPPLTRNDLFPDVLGDFENADLLVFNLHGMPGTPAFFGRQDGTPVALHADQVRKLNLGRAVVFAYGCYTGDDSNPMRDALLDAGARAVVAGAGINYGGSHWPVGADWLLMVLRVAMSAASAWSEALDIDRVLETMSKVLRASPLIADHDAAEFRVWRRDESKDHANV